MAQGIEFVSEGSISNNNDSTSNVESVAGSSDNSIEWAGNGEADAGRAQETDLLKGSQPSGGDIVFAGDNK
jgi:hypothetical protein